MLFALLFALLFIRVFSNTAVPIAVYGNPSPSTNAHVADITIDTNYFYRNSGPNTGAIYIKAGDSTVTVTKSTFENNVATEHGDGGSITCTNISPNTSAVLQFQGAASTFKNNKPRNIGISN
jgi:predicted outer membrane repeat protein